MSAEEPASVVAARQLAREAHEIHALRGHRRARRPGRPAIARPIGDGGFDAGRGSDMVGAGSA